MLLQRERLAKVLIVDDDADLIKTLTARLMPSGYRVSEAFDGRDALDIFLKDRPDFVLLDLHMPKLDGLAVLREMRDIDPSVPVVVMTADAGEGRARTAMEEGASDFLVKPLDLDYLENSVLANVAVRQAEQVG